MGFKVWRSGPAGPRDFLFSKHPYCLWGQPRLCPVGMGTLITMVKYLMHEAKPSSPSSTKVKNEWSCASASLICHAFLVSTGTLLTVVALQCVHCLYHWQCITVCALSVPLTVHYSVCTFCTTDSALQNVEVSGRQEYLKLNSSTLKKTKQPENIQYRQTVDPICLLIVWDSDMLCHTLSSTSWM